VTVTSRRSDGKGAGRSALATCDVTDSVLHRLRSSFLGNGPTHHRNLRGVLRQR